MQSVEQLPSCPKCNCNTTLATTINRRGDTPEVQIFHCQKCERHEMYRVVEGALERW